MAVHGGRNRLYSECEFTLENKINIQGPDYFFTSSIQQTESSKHPMQLPEYSRTST